MNYTEILKAAEQGNAEAQFNLGLIYYNGDGVPRDDPEAAKWYFKAAEQGHIEAQLNLGVMYYFDGVLQQDYVEAVNLYLNETEKSHAVQMNSKVRQ